MRRIIFHIHSFPGTRYNNCFYLVCTCTYSFTPKKFWAKWHAVFLVTELPLQSSVVWMHICRCKLNGMQQHLHSSLMMNKIYIQHLSLKVQKWKHSFASIASFCCTYFCLAVSLQVRMSKSKRHIQALNGWGSVIHAAHGYIRSNEPILSSNAIAALYAVSPKCSIYVSNFIPLEETNVIVGTSRPKTWKYVESMKKIKKIQNIMILINMQLRVTDYRLPTQ